jgi:nucleoside-diphosphate-sugar epimerase
MDILIIGGTRNVGFFLIHELLQAGHHVTMLNRGLTPDELPNEVERIRCNRTDPGQLKQALNGRSFDAVIDMVLYTGAEAQSVIETLPGQIGHYIFISTGQVYLVREDARRPFKETDYAGRLIPAPKPNTYGYEEWLYGTEKRDAEDVLAAAWETQQFPYTSLRTPMIISERDPFQRLYNYVLRIKDGGPILAPETPNYPLRHVYAGDIVQAVIQLINTGKGKGQVYNISDDKTYSLEKYLKILGSMLEREPHIVRMKWSKLYKSGFLPDCSPFSDRWMSELDNTRSKQELGLTYTPVRTYLEQMIQHFQANPPDKPASYLRRTSEKNFVLH